MKKEHEMHEEMKDNRMVKDNHQEGIHRVCQKKGDMKAGQGGKMGVKLEKAEFNRKDQYTPVKG